MNNVRDRVARLQARWQTASASEQRNGKRQGEENQLNALPNRARERDTPSFVEDDATADLDIRSLDVIGPPLPVQTRANRPRLAAVSEIAAKREVFDAAELLPPPLNLGPELHQRVRNRVLKNFRDWVRQNNRNVNRTDTQRRSLPGKFADIFTDKKFFRSFLKQQLRTSNAPVSCC